MIDATLKTLVLNLVEVHGGSPREIVDAAQKKGFSEKDVKKAIWELLDENELVFTADWKLDRNAVAAAA